MRKFLFPLLVLVLAAGPAAAQGSQSTAPSGRSLPLSFDTAPVGYFPIGETSTYFALGVGSTFGVDFQLPIRFLALRAQMGYCWDPMREASQSLSLGTVAGGVDLRFALTPRLLANLQTQAGMYYGMLHGTPEFLGDGGAFISSSVGIAFFVTPALALGLSGGYSNYLGLSQGITAGLGVIYDPAGASGRQQAFGTRRPVQRPELLQAGAIKGEGEGLKLIETRWENVFPVFYKYYDGHPVGHAVVKNHEKETVTDIKLTLMVKGYMDSPTTCATPGQLAGGEQAEVDLNVLFNKTVLEITEAEGTKVAVDLTLQYKHRGEWVQETLTDQIRIYNRNNMVWDDDRKVAAFVTRTDPSVQLFAKNVLNVTKGKGSKAVNENLMAAMAIHEALRLFGVSYAVDPRSSYAELSQNAKAVDYLQFPRQTLEVQGGDCDDLSILYSALLESVNVPTAFVTVPDHIFMAVSLGVDRQEALSTFAKVEDLIFTDEAAWLPLEVTERQGGFLKAWQEGAKQWREYTARKQSTLYPFAQAAGLYESAAYIDTAGKVTKAIALPNEDKIVRAYLEELVRFIDGEIFPQVAKMQSEITRSRESPASVNKLGVLYARYGLFDRAEKEFDRLLKKNPSYVPGLVNMGNLYYLREEIEKSLQYFEKAYGLAPNDSKVLLSLAQASHRMENYGVVSRVYGQLKQLDPELAYQFAYLDLQGDEAVRAADVTKTKGVVKWSESEE